MGLVACFSATNCPLLSSVDLATESMLDMYVLVRTLPESELAPRVTVCGQNNSVDITGGE
jgi:hypothetical protein